MQRGILAELEFDQIGDTQESQLSPSLRAVDTGLQQHVIQLVTGTIGTVTCRVHPAKPHEYATKNCVSSFCEQHLSVKA
jgi:hypothetical protein